MNTDPHEIRARVEAVLADLPGIDPGPDAGQDETAPSDAADVDALAADIDTAGRRLEEAHQILVDALESVEKG